MSKKESVKVPKMPLKESVKVPVKESVKVPVKESVKMPVKESVKVPLKESVKKSQKLSVSNVDNMIKLLVSSGPSVVDSKEFQNLLPPKSTFNKSVVNKPISEYQIFSSEKRSELVAKYPELDSKNITQELKKMWKNLPLEKKQPYLKARDERVRVYLEMFEKNGLKLSPDLIMNPETGKPVKRTSKKGIELQKNEKGHVQETQESQESQESDDDDEVSLSGDDE
jgi:hypothetical protein